MWLRYHSCMTRLLPLGVCALALPTFAFQSSAPSTYEVPEGYAVEVIADQVQIHAGRAMAWDAFERLWILESSDFSDPSPLGMSTPQDMGELVYFEDTNGDGKLDKRVLFASGLSRPGAFCPAYGGILTLCDSELVWLFDRDKDGRSDLAEVVASDLQISEVGPGVTFDSAAIPSSLRQGVDNWFYLQNHNMRFRMQGGSWQQEPSTPHNTLGFAEDQWGRHVYSGVDGRTSISSLPAQETMSGYRLDLTIPGMLGFWMPETTYFGFESFSGTRLQESDRGSLFAINGSDRHVARFDLVEERGRLISPQITKFLTLGGAPVYPIGIATGPDGALYICGRSILRITHQGVYNTRSMYDNRVLGHASSLELCASLGSANGWRRRTAQRLLIERGLGFGRTADALLLSLETLAKKGLPTGRLHAFWTLEGLGLLSPKLLLEAFQVEKEPHLLSVLVRLSADMYSAQATTPEQRTEFMRAFEALTLPGLQDAPLAPPLGTEPIRLGGLERNANAKTQRVELSTLGEPRAIELNLVRWQLAASLGKLHKEPENSALSPQFKLARLLLAGRDDDELLRTNLLGSFANQELQLFDSLGTSGLLAPNIARALGFALAAASLNSEQRAGLGKLCNLAERYQAQGALRGARDYFADSGFTGSTPFQTQLPFPTGLATALAYKAHPLHAEAGDFAPLLEFMTPPTPAVNTFGRLPLAGEELALFNKQVERGEVVYNMICAACHMPGGEGLESLGPPLMASAWLERSDEELASIVLYGLEGEIEVLGKTWNMAMPSWASLPDQELADCLTYTRATFGDESVREAAITEQTLREVRAAKPR